MTDTVTQLETLHAKDKKTAAKGKRIKPQVVQIAADSGNLYAMTDTGRLFLRSWRDKTWSEVPLDLPI